MKRQFTWLRILFLQPLLTIAIFDANAQQQVAPVAAKELASQSQPAPVPSFGHADLVVMTVETMSQGQFKGTTVPGTTGAKIELTSFSFEVSSAADMATGMSSGKRYTQPVVVNKMFTPASLQLYDALIKNQLLKTVTIEFYDTKTGISTNTNPLVNTIKLTNVRVIGFKQNIITDKASTAAKYGLNEEIKFYYQKIEITDASGLTTIDDATQR